MTHKPYTLAFEHALGMFGLFLLLILGKLVHLEAVPVSTVSGRARRAAARFGVSGIGLVGAVIDALPPRPRQVAARPRLGTPSIVPERPS